MCLTSPTVRSQSSCQTRGSPWSCFSLCAQPAAVPVVSLSSCWSWVMWKDESTYRFASVHTKLRLLLYREWRREWIPESHPLKPLSQHCRVLLLPRFYLGMRHLKIGPHAPNSAVLEQGHIISFFVSDTGQSLFIQCQEVAGELKDLWSIRNDRGWRQFSHKRVCTCVYS